MIAGNDQVFYNLQRIKNIGLHFPKFSFDRKAQRISNIQKLPIFERRQIRTFDTSLFDIFIMTKIVVRGNIVVTCVIFAMILQSGC